MISWGLWIAGFILWAILFELTGSTSFDVLESEDSPLFGFAVLAMGSGCLVGWLCFAYLDTTLRKRWAALLAIAGGSWLLGTILIVAGTGP
ncbi:MAG: hypothetical protein WD096_10095 [Actinomycetota bacterium]